MSILSIVIPVFNSLAYTKKCIENLKTELEKAENIRHTAFIVIVDDGSTDNTSEWIVLNHPDVIICKGNGNLWWSGGVNLGIRYSFENIKADYILLWNNDIIAAPGYFQCLFNLLDTNDTSNIILSEIYFDNKEELIIFSRGGHFNPVTGKHFLIGYGKKAKEFHDTEFEINWFPGMGTLMHSSVFESTGYFDEKNFPQYKGDADFALRAKKAGFNLKLNSGLKIFNDKENSGFSNNKSLSIFLKSLVSKKSNANIYRDYLFYNRHSESPRAYSALIKKYGKHVLGFVKWKILSLFGLKRQRQY